MQIRQVFDQYPGPRDDGLGRMTWCPDCGSVCDIRAEGVEKRRFCARCRKYHYVNPSSSVSVFVSKDDEFVLCRRQSSGFGASMWCLPCGFIEYDEDFHTAALRETKEETGLDIRVQSIISVSSNFLNRRSHTLTMVLLGEPVGGRLEGGDDIVEVRWFHLADELSPMAFEADKHLIARYSEAPIVGAPVLTV